MPVCLLSVAFDVSWIEDKMASINDKLRQFGKYLGDVAQVGAIYPHDDDMTANMPA